MVQDWSRYMAEGLYYYEVCSEANYLSFALELLDENSQLQGNINLIQEASDGGDIQIVPSGGGTFTINKRKK